VSMFEYHRGANLDSKLFFSNVYRELVAARKVSYDPARYLAFAEVLRSEKNWSAVEEVCQRIVNDAEATNDARARALLFVQQTDYTRGRRQASTQIGLSIQRSYPDVLVARIPSWKLLNESCGSEETPVPVKEDCAAATEALVRDLRTQAARGDNSDSARAKALLTAVMNQEQ